MSKRSVEVGEEQEFYVMLNLNLSGFDAVYLELADELSFE